MDALDTTIMLVLIVSSIKSGIGQENEFRDVSTCMCPGCDLVVECAVTGGGITVWKGTVFDGCQNEEITIRHSQFTSGRALINESCGTRGPIVGRGVAVVGGSFTSQLTVTFSEDLINTTIECANESGQIVGSKQITDTLSALPTYTLTNVTIVLSETIPGQLTITWDLASNDTLNVTQFLTTSNCGMCSTTTLSNFAICNLTANDLKVCSVTVIIQDNKCGVTTNATSVVLVIKDFVTSMYNMLTTTDLTKWTAHVARRNWSTVTVFLPLASTGILLMLLVLVVVFVIAIMKYKLCAQHKTHQIAFVTEEPTDHSDNPVGNDIMMDLGLGQYSLLHHPSDEEGMMTYIEIGPSTRNRTEVTIIPSVDKVEYAEVNHRKNTQSQDSVLKNDVDKYLNLDTLLIQIRCQVTPLWHEFGVAAGVPMDTLNKCLNYTPEESIVKVLDYWLRQSKRTWEDVAYVLNEINLQELAETMLKIYNIQFGLCPTAVVDEAIMISAITSVGTSDNSEAVSEKSETPPPLPPKP